MRGVSDSEHMEAQLLLFSKQSCLGPFSVGSKHHCQVQTDSTNLKTTVLGQEELSCGHVFPLAFFPFLHVSLDQPHRFWMGQKEEEASFSTMALNVFLDTSTARRLYAFSSASYKCNGIFFFLLRVTLRVVFSPVLRHM